MRCAPIRSSRRLPLRCLLLASFQRGRCHPSHTMHTPLLPHSSSHPYLLISLSHPMGKCAPRVFSMLVSVRAVLLLCQLSAAPVARSPRCVVDYAAVARGKGGGGGRNPITRAAVNKYCWVLVGCKVWTAASVYPRVACVPVCRWRGPGFPARPRLLFIQTLRAARARPAGMAQCCHIYVCIIPDAPLRRRASSTWTCSHPGPSPPSPLLPPSPSYL